MHGFHVRIVLNTRVQSPFDISIPNTIFDKLPVHRPNPTNRKNATFNPYQKDYRFGPIRIDWMDSNMPASTSSTGKEKDRGKDGTSDEQSYTTSSTDMYRLLGHAVAHFVANETVSGSTNLPEGVIHVYRENETPTGQTSTSRPVTDSVILGILAVPSWMAPSDLLTFVAPAAETISHLRILRFVIFIYQSTSNLHRWLETVYQIVQLLSSSSRNRKMPLSSSKLTMANLSTPWRWNLTPAFDSLPNLAMALR